MLNIIGQQNKELKNKMMCYIQTAINASLKGDMLERIMYGKPEMVKMLEFFGTYIKVVDFKLDLRDYFSDYYEDRKASFCMEVKMKVNNLSTPVYLIINAEVTQYDVNSVIISESNEILEFYGENNNYRLINEDMKGDILSKIIKGGESSVKSNAKEVQEFYINFFKGEVLSTWMKEIVEMYNEWISLETAKRLGEGYRVHYDFDNSGIECTVENIKTENSGSFYVNKVMSNSLVVYD